MVEIIDQAVEKRRVVSSLPNLAFHQDEKREKNLGVQNSPADHEPTASRRHWHWTMFLPILRQRQGGGDPAKPAHPSSQEASVQQGSKVPSTSTSGTMSVDLNPSSSSTGTSTQHTDTKTHTDQSCRDRMRVLLLVSPSLSEYHKLARSKSRRR